MVTRNKKQRSAGDDEVGDRDAGAEAGKEKRRQRKKIGKNHRREEEKCSYLNGPHGTFITKIIIIIII